MNNDLDFLNNTSVSAIMRKPEGMVGPKESLGKALSMGRKKGRYEIPVVDEGKVIGIIGCGILAKRRHLPLSVTVDTVMTPPPRVFEEDSLPMVSEVLLTNDYISVPVTRDGELTGIVTRRDVIKHLLELDINIDIPVKDIMNVPVISVKGTDSISKVLHELSNLHERALPVTDGDGKLRGIFALDKRDGSLLARRKKASLGEKKGEKIHPHIDVKSVMQTPPVSVDLDARLGKVMELIVKHKISSVIVVENEIPMGIITSLDIIEMVSSCKDRDEVLVQVSGFDGSDLYEYDSLYSVIGKYIPKISYYVDPKILNLHVKHHHHANSLTKYTLSARLGTGRKIFISRREDWDLISALHETMGSLEKQVEKFKGKYLSKRH